MVRVVNVRVVYSETRKSSNILFTGFLGFIHVVWGSPFKIFKSQPSRSRVCLAIGHTNVAFAENRPSCCGCYCT